MAHSYDQLKLVWTNPRRPLCQRTGVDSMQPAVAAYERQAAILACRGERIIWITERELWRWQ